MDSDERARSPIPECLSDPAHVNSDDGSFDAQFNNASNSQRDTSDIFPTRVVEDEEASEKGYSQQLAEKLARAEERIAMLESKIEVLEARK